MKLLLVMLICVLGLNGMAQKDSIGYVLSRHGFRCGVAHWDKDGIFSCDMNGTYYPETIFDSTIRKWFIKIDNGDSLFHYRHDVIEIYIWNGRPKNQEYGYESEQMRNERIGITIPNRYTTDTLKFNRQSWRPKP